MKDERELAAVGVAVEELALPVHHVGVARSRADAERTVDGVASLGSHVERAHVVVDRLTLEAEHSIGEPGHAAPIHCRTVRERLFVRHRVIEKNNTIHNEHQNTTGMLDYHAVTHTRV